MGLFSDLIKLLIPKRYSQKQSATAEPISDVAVMALAMAEPSSGMSDASDKKPYQHFQAFSGPFWYHPKSFLVRSIKSG